MKKKIAFILIILIILITMTIFSNMFNHPKKVEILKTIKPKEFHDPEYNTEYITNINEINLENKDVKNKYQFVYMADLQASVIDENEPNEQIRESLMERNQGFTSLNPNHIGPELIFNEIVNYTNEKNADALLLGGDIIDSPSDSNFNLLRDNLNENLKVKYLYTLGNHDWSFAWDYHTKNTEETYYPKFKEFMDDVNVSYLEYEDLIILAINDSKDQIEKESVQKIKKVLEKNKPTIVMLHVPISTKHISEEAIRIRNRVSAIGEYGIEPDENTKEAIDLILSDKYKVFYVLSGHVHFAVKDNLNERIIEDITAPAYSGDINLIKINN